MNSMAEISKDPCCQGACGNQMVSAEASRQLSSDPDGQSQPGCDTCYRCGSRPATLLTRKASCAECFLEVFRRKFASNLRSRFIRRNEKREPTVVIVDGGVFSTSLLHLMLERNKRRYVTAAHAPAESDTSRHLFGSDDMAINCVISVDDHVGTSGSFEERSKKFFKHVTTVVNNLGNSNVAEDWVIEGNHINEAVILDEVKLSHIAVCYFLHKEKGLCNERCSSLKAHLTRMYDSLSCDELAYSLEILRRLNLKKYLAECRLNGTSVFVGDTQELIARRVLMLTCIAAGDRVAFRSAFVDKHSLRPDTSIFRLLKSFSSKEVALYHRLNGLPDMPSLDLFWHSSSQSTILGCVNELVSCVAFAHSSTLYNVSNVVEKLTPAFPGSTSGTVLNVYVHSGAVCQVCEGAVYESDTEVLVYV
ncbi:cytoplasmic tRNA 2-thiolation 2 [Babesia ovis]|uniref:Cytoplasmic tRNA 2-thiolation 2 n=1 Tax=Babesia ovis TaxID=5869 RepID=A0A9W5T883_BABOV|nr:cytoplasmic tRNA 2-thiolation 2 [Babesia ovis]